MDQVHVIRRKVLAEGQQNVEASSPEPNPMITVKVLEHLRRYSIYIGLAAHALTLIFQ